MIIPPPARLRAALVLALSVSLATACAATPPPVTPEVIETPAATPSGPAPEPSVEPSEAPIAAEPTCDTMIAEDIVADFASVGWTARADPFFIGELELADGLQCVWADFGGPAGDHLQIFGWAPITAEDAADAQAALIDQGWVRESSPEGVIITESPETTIAVDGDGYGLTYLFGDGWVKYADTKQGLVLIEWPPA